jgi:2-C-methyl-D-erythritol 2,4-cyclodiphosphate synthase
MIRIGHGFDAHKFDGKEFNTCIVIGGVNIPHSHALLAHSDGDVLIHALCDAILGALALGDIGRHFPDTNADYANIDSRILLRKVMQEAINAGYGIVNADMTIIAQVPKMAPHIHSMCSHLAEDLLVSFSRVNIKATTTEKMGFTGRKEGIAAHAVVLLQKTT